MRMRELTVTAGKFQLLLDYLDQIGVDAAQVAAAVHINAQRLEQLAAGSSELLLLAQQLGRAGSEAECNLHHVLARLMAGDQGSGTVAWLSDGTQAPSAPADVLALGMLAPPEGPGRRRGYLPAPCGELAGGGRIGVPRLPRHRLPAPRRVRARARTRPA